MPTPTRTRLVVAFAAAALAAAPLLPAGAHPEDGPEGGAQTEPGEDDPRHGLEEVGFHPLHGEGFNTDVWTQTTDDGLFAYVGTWGTLTGSADTGRACPSETDNPGSPSRSGVKIVDATDPASPELIGTLATVPGSQNNDVKVLEDVVTDGFAGDLLVHSLEPCGVNLALGLVDVVNDVPKPQTGFQVYDVTEPTAPVKLGAFNNGGFGTHNLYAFDRPDLDRAFVAAVHNDSDLVTGSDYLGKIQFVDVSDPGSPTLVSEWQLADAEEQGGPTFDELCQPRGNHLASCNLHDVWVSDDGTTVYLSYWDAGLVLLDVTDPEDPRLIGQTQPGGTDNEGNTHAAVPYHLGNRHYVIVGDEDFVGPGPAPFAVVEDAPDDAAVAPGERFGASEMSATTPLAEVAPVGPFPVLEADSDVSCTFVGAGSFAQASGVEGWIGVVKRGNCTFQQMVTNAEMAGADAVLVVNTDPEATESGTAAGNIPALMIAGDPGDRLLEAVGPASADVTVTLDLLPPDELNPWGFMRVVDVSDEDPANWGQVSTFKAPFVDTFEGQDPENVFSAHNPIVGPDGRIYFSWYTNGVRVLEPQGNSGRFRERAWFRPLPEDHDDDNDSDPNGAQEDNVGFWGSKAVEHPETGELLIFNSDLNRGLYILRSTEPGSGSGGGGPQGATAEVQPATASLPATGAGFPLAALALLVGGVAVRRRR